MLKRLRLFAVFLLCGFLIFSVPIFIPRDFGTVPRIILSVSFLIIAVILHRKENPRRYFSTVFAFFVASSVYFFEYFLYLNQSSLSWLSSSRMDLYVYFKILSTLLVVIPIVLLTKASGKDLASIYLTKGKFSLGLIFGLTTFLVFLVTSVQSSTLLYGGRNLTFGSVISWAPWVFIFVFANGFKEEVQFRGLFLKKYEALLGVGLSNFLQATIFASAHLGETYSPVILIFLVIVFLLGLAYGAIIQKTNSLLGSVLFHAGSDIPVILGIFSNL